MKQSFIPNECGCKIIVTETNMVKKTGCKPSVRQKTTNFLENVLQQHTNIKSNTDTSTDINTNTGTNSSTVTNTNIVTNCR